MQHFSQYCGAEKHEIMPNFIYLVVYISGVGSAWNVQDGGGKGARCFSRTYCSCSLYDHLFDLGLGKVTKMLISTAKWNLEDYRTLPINTGGEKNTTPKNQRRKKEDSPRRYRLFTRIICKVPCNMILANSLISPPSCYLQETLLQDLVTAVL